MVLCRDGIEVEETPVMDTLSLVLGSHLKSCHKGCKSIAIRGTAKNLFESFVSDQIFLEEVKYFSIEAIAERIS